MKYQKIPAISGFDLIKILKKDGWIEHRQTTHGFALKKRLNDRTRVTIVPKTKVTLPTGTLMAILGEKQTGLGRSGLVRRWTNTDDEVVLVPLIYEISWLLEDPYFQTGQITTKIAATQPK